MPITIRPRGLILRPSSLALALAGILFVPPSAAPAADLIVPNAATVTLSAGTYSYVSVVVQSGGTLQVNDVVAINADYFQVESGGLVDGLGRGFAAGTGPGAGGVTREGGGHGGRGGVAWQGAGGATYGSTIQPLTAGSGGSTGTAGPGGAGGAALWLSASGAVLVQGIIDLRGGQGSDGEASVTSGGGGGGAGGGLYLNGSSLDISGQLKVGGGPGGSGSTGGTGGGGGRLALRSATAAFSLTGTYDISGAPGGLEPSTDTAPGGAGGTAVFFPGTDLWVATDISLDAPDWTLGQIRVLSNGRLRLNSAHSITATSLVLENGAQLSNVNGHLNFGGSLSLPTGSRFHSQGDALTLTALSMATGAELSLGPGSFTRVQSATLSPGWKLSTEDAVLSLGPSLVVSSAEQVQLGGLILCDGDVTFLSGSGSTLKGLAEVRALRFLVESGAGLNGDARGYGPASGPGSTDFFNYSVGAGHAGPGGDSGWIGPGSGGAAYDDPSSPSQPGSGGTSGNTGVPGGAGGAALRVIASLAASLSGTVSVNGAAGGNSSNNIPGGGGSGGSIYVQAPQIWGNGFLSAHGGSGGNGLPSSFGGGGGSGGLIYMDSTGGPCGLGFSMDLGAGSGGPASFRAGGNGSFGNFGTNCPATPTFTVSPTRTASPSATPTPTPVPVGSCATTGWGPSEGDLNLFGVAYVAVRLRFDQATVLSRLRARFGPSSGSGLARMALYSSNGVRPTSLLLQSEEGAYGPAPAAFTVPPTLLAAGEYWAVLTTNAAYTADMLSVSGVEMYFRNAGGYGPFAVNFPIGSGVGSNGFVMALEAESCGVGTTLTPTLTSTHSPSATPSRTPSPTETPTFSASPTTTPTPSITETRTISPTHSVSPTFSPTPTQTPSFSASPTSNVRLSNASRTLLGPSPVRRGRPLCAWFKAPPHWAEVELFNVTGEHVARAQLGSGGLCLATERLAPGVYLARIRTESGEGREDRLQKVAVVR